jgi:predicted metalloendopeptidase
MIENIRNSFIDRLNQATWMDNDSKEKAIGKVYNNKYTIPKKHELYSRRMLSTNKLDILII